MMQNDFPFDLGHAVAGATGGVLRYLLRPRRPYWEALVSGAMGLLLALYFTPIAAPIVDTFLDRLIGDGRVGDDQLAAGVGCMIGMAAPNLIERTIDFVRMWQAAKPPVEPSK